MSEPTFDFDNDRTSTRPRMWRQFKAAVGSVYYADDFVADLEAFARQPGHPGFKNPRLLLAVALHAFAASGRTEREQMELAFFAWIDRRKDGREPQPPFCPSPFVARVRANTRVVELRDGETQHNGTVLHILAECVIVQRDEGTRSPGEPSRVALRWNEFAVHPEAPAGAVGFPTGKEADHD